MATTQPWYTSRSRIPCFLEHDTYREKWAPNLVNVNIDIRVGWINRNAWLLDMMGAHYSSPATGGQGSQTIAGNQVPNSLVGTTQNTNLDGDYNVNWNPANSRWEFVGAFGSASGFYLQYASPNWQVGLIGSGPTTPTQPVAVYAPAFSVIFSSIDLTGAGGTNTGQMFFAPAGTAGNLGGAGGTITRFNPQANPLYPNLYCVGCDSKQNKGVPTCDTNGWIVYDTNDPTNPDPSLNALGAGPVYTVAFAPLPYDIRSNADVAASPEGELIRYVVRSPKQIGEQIQATGQFQYVTQTGMPAANDPVPTPPAIQTPYRQLVYEWRYVPDPITNVIATADALYGKVNNAFFDVNYGNYAPNTILFLGAEYERIPLTPAMNTVWNIKFNFAFRPQTWNVAYRPTLVGGGTGAPQFPQWDGVQTVATPHQPPYMAQNMYKLFKV